MRGNHIVWGRVEEPTPDATTEAERNHIATVKLQAMRGRSDHCKEVWLDGQRLGFVRVRAGGQYWKVKRNDEWLSAGYEWSENDPPWGLAILALLQQSFKAKCICGEISNHAHQRHAPLASHRTTARGLRGSGD